ncbi:MAG: flagellar filament capping protein FliD [Simkaniaceae bacterium]|nr:flagellar filament capping protein FliD [Simkaniaceae bacterium]
MAIDIESIFSSQSSIDRLVSQYMMLERQPLDVLLEKQSTLEEKKTVFSDLDSKLSTLLNVTERFTDPVFDYFAAKKATSSDNDKFTTTAGSSAELGNHSLSVERLAISDTRVSKQYTDTSSSFTALTADQTFTIEVGHPTDADATNRVSISVTVGSSVFTQTDDLVLLDIASAVNSAMSDAVTAETIDSNEVIHASVVTEESGSSRLLFRSERSGYTYRQTFTDSADSLLGSLEINNLVQSTGTAGGYITDIGTGATDSLLNAKFTLDGLTFYRDSNNVTDAISGITLQLLNTFSTTETITVNADTEVVKKEVNDFLDAYNGVITFLRENARFNPDTQKSGLLSNDLVYKGIINSLRSYSVANVTGASSSTYTKLYNIGIEADDEGLLSIVDSEKFDGAIEGLTSNISDLFNASDGVAVNIKSYIDNFVEVGGTIDDSKRNIDSQLTLLQDRVSFTEELLYQREAQLRNDFSKLQEAMIKLSTQQSFFKVFN